MWDIIRGTWIGKGYDVRGIYAFRVVGLEVEVEAEVEVE
jgi:hypothetical protein